MPRTARASVGELCYHVINRGNARAEVFRKPEDYAAFQELLREAAARVRMRVVAYCLMPNHFHLLLWPRADGDLSRFMQWLLTAQVRRYHRHYQSSGHVWQGRFKAFPIEQDAHLLTVMRYIERNALRAGLVARAEDWRWSSLRERGGREAWLQAGPVAGPTDWVGWVEPHGFTAVVPFVTSAKPAEACPPLPRLRHAAHRLWPTGRRTPAVHSSTALQPWLPA